VEVRGAEREPVERGHIVARPALGALLSDPRWRFHTNAGNANMSVLLADDRKAADLIAFLLSIDEAEPELDVPADPGTGQSFDGCPASFP
jgi:hypothetical protein